MATHMRSVLRMISGYECPTAWVPISEEYQAADEPRRLEMHSDLCKIVFSGQVPPALRFPTGQVVVFNPANIETVVIEFTDNPDGEARDA